MLRLYQHVSRQLALTVLVCICVFGASSYFIFKNIELNRYENLLKTTVNTVKVSISKEDDLKGYAKDFQNSTNMRLSVIDDSGKVISDSAVDTDTMRNHNNRQEIMEARKSEFGVSLRYSDTLNADFLNVASKVTIKESPYFIRVTTPLKSIMKNFYIVWANVAVVFSLILFAGFFWTNRFNKRIKDEVSKLNIAFNALANKDYKSEFNFGFAKEFVEIGVYLKKLTKRVEKRAKQKRKYTAKIKLISRQKSDIISAISHEFKNPIAAVMGYAQTLSDDENISGDIRKKFLDKIVKNSRKISDMIDRLSLASKLESGDLSPKISEFDFNLLVKDIISSFGMSNPLRVIKYDGETTFVKADAQMMEIVVTNLIHNALKYSQDEVSVKLKNRNFSVSDRGIGIKEDEVDKITAKFYRCDTKSWDNSLGLGLAFVSYILKAHGLELKIETVLHEGSVFSFYFA